MDAVGGTGGSGCSLTFRNLTFTVSSKKDHKVPTVSVCVCVCVCVCVWVCVCLCVYVSVSVYECL